MSNVSYFNPPNNTEQIDQTGIDLKSGDGGGTYNGMNTTDLHTRLSRMEGGWTIFQVASGIVTAVMVGGMGLLLAVQLSTQSNVKDLAGQVDGLSSQVEALPGKINSNLMELNRTLATAITASKNQTPQVILVPAPAVQPPTQTTPNQ